MISMSRNILAKPNLFSIAVIFVLLLVFQAHSEEPVVTIDRIVIETDSSQNQSTQADTEIHIKTSQPRSQNAASLVGRVSGVHIRRSGGPDATTQLSIRGSSSNQILLVLDGIPLETAGGDGIGLEHISTSALSRINIFKNDTPIGIGSSAIGGVVELHSRTAKKGVHERFGFGGGSFNTINGFSETSIGTENMSLVTGINYYRTNGSYHFLDDNGTPVNQADDSVVKRRNNEHQTVHPYLNWKHHLDNRTQLGATLHFFRVDHGVPGLQNFQSLTAGRENTEWLGRVTFTRDEILKGQGKLQHAFFFRTIHSQFYDLNGEIGLGSAQDNHNTTILLGDRMDLHWQANSWLQFDAGGEYQFERFVPSDKLAVNPQGTPSLRHLMTFSLDAKIRLHSRLQLMPQIRTLFAFYDINNDDPSLANAGTFFSKRTETQPSGRLALNWQPHEFITAKISGGRAVRLPKFGELFGDQGTTLGNPQLTSESAFNYDAGVTYSRQRVCFLDALKIEAVFFGNHFDDLIQYEIQNGVSRASNLGSARVMGVEAGLSLVFLKFASTTFNYTFQDAVDQSSNAGRRLVGRARHEFNAEWALNFAKWEMSVTGNFIDSMPLDALNTQTVRNRLLIETGASWNFWKEFRLGIEARNLTDSQLVDAVGFPLPGRSYFARLEGGF